MTMVVVREVLTQPATWRPRPPPLPTQPPDANMQGTTEKPGVVLARVTVKVADSLTLPQAFYFCFCFVVVVVVVIFDRRIYLCLSKSIQSAAGLKALKPAASGRYLMCKSLHYYY